ncbi:hypothetical protein L1987_48323 [Smallanthus sonchifolius]|uniref:Uncharacterized protein n=1 Tax=Smallanthus sonchifolius TaxID=185202 RepID=A0ACB9FRP4_9ASTR|nr:hypothetical protein L1987_48323 [Smallanthus sonchifolius]
MNDMGKALVVLRKGGYTLTNEVNSLRERLNEEPMIFEDVFDLLAFNDVVIFYVEGEEKEEEKVEKSSDHKPSTQLPKQKNDDDEGPDGTRLGAGGTSSSAPAIETATDEGNKAGDDVGATDAPESGVAEDELMNEEDVEEMSKDFIE